MLDINFIRDNKELVKEGARKKHIEVDIDQLISLDDKRKEQLQEVEKLRALQNDVSKKIGLSENEESRAQMITEMQALKDDISQKESSLKEVMREWQELMLRVPNVPDVSVPEGKTDEDNQQVKSWGEKTKFSFEPKDHIELMTALDMVDFERGSKVHGFRGYFLKNDGARLSFALWNYALDFFLKKGFELILAPAIAKQEHFYGTGHLPTDAEDLYKTQDDDYLSGTAEVPMMGYHSNEVLSLAELPKKYLAFSPCFRREIGSYGKDTKGLIRVHEFYKVEQVVLCEANHEMSVEYHEELTKNSEKFLQLLGIPYRVVINCAGDLGVGQVKKYDIESWVPSEDKYRETHSSSYFHDFQTRRFNIKYKGADEKPCYAHSLNNTATASPRFLVALVENYQNEDGSITIPEVLRSYMGKDKIEKANK